jgi:hypothetical protein
MTHLIEDGHHVPCAIGYVGNYGYGYNHNNDNNDVTAGFRHTSDGQREIVSAIYTSENDVRTHLDASTNALLNGQHDLSKEIGDSKFYTSNAISDVRQEISNSGNDINKEVGNVRFQLASLNNDVNKEIAYSRLQASQISNDTNKEICAVKESLSEKYASLLLENHKAESRTREKLIRGFGETKLDACKNTSELAKQIAECCCETQKAILAQSATIRELDLKQAAQTRELALTIENNRLRDKCDNQDRHSRSGDIEIAVTNVLRNANFSRS